MIYFLKLSSLIVEFVNYGLFMNLIPSRERAALVREEDVDEKEEAAGPRTADLHRDCRPGIRVKH